MRVRAIAADELPEFACLADDDLRFVVEDGDRVVGRVGYSSTAPAELALYGLTLPWDGEYMATGTPLLRESLRDVRATGAEVVETRVNPAFHSFPRERESVLVAGGFELVQEKLRLVGTAAPFEHRPLALRTRSQVGRAAFVHAVMRVTDGTLDRLDALEVERLGARTQAEWYVRGIESETVDDELWLLAYEEERLAGLLVLGEWDPATGVIAYVGVAPAARGRGLVHDLVGAARSRLHARGYSNVVADVDVANRPMLAALERAGMRPETDLRVYWARLGRVSD